VLILHGTADELIPIDESEQLIARLRAAGDEAELVPIEGAAHGFGYGVETGFQKTAVARAERYLKERV